MPMLVSLLTPVSILVWLVSIASLLFLAVLGAVAAYTGGANVLKGAVRVTFWGAVAMAATAAVGALFGTKV
jgi:vacuolar iron transporter family protein